MPQHRPDVPPRTGGQSLTLVHAAGFLATCIPTEQGQADKDAVVAHCLEEFKAKFAFFVGHIQASWAQGIPRVLQRSVCLLSWNTHI